ncbi:hypothetical protein LOZ61_006806 [Ophidiomyces ophidiicola]|uniref:uncharacterized protein n=1 Tax=Ophidiomyces ophidiicola TaxID=1387563 RepID=UPI0020C2BA5B|nr:uncharacterized protein LOZ57_000608 [Ophidiomyces ophidiicola]KAI1906164.1 hypothetical protein LOZ61_006806 [Ophidiomyces ophidiicola]KAI1954258.1 hypothetical protein LOZ57_000608 [Ophidiomyces ophidiicola]KAI2138876.1 hypothetical protein LOZ27_005348 [Ophidiomyces ophidiicola]KAI2191636.1 hypothetical protein LOZ20_004745 [Ophidiomyces ophidiicola]KAI2386452.1 hypothetical protein LOY90_006196 [Ophidiomyces ophidiicola]
MAPDLLSVFFFLMFIITLAAILHRLIQRKQPAPIKADHTGDAERLHKLRALSRHHEVASVLSTLVREDGAGTWPPRANHDSWPHALRPYKNIYLELISLLPTARPSLDDDINNERRNKYRSIMRKLLSERVNIFEVEILLASVEAGSWDLCPRDVYNGFHCCVAVCRHAYRWATIPVVRVAQLETVIDFPPELDIPWPFFQRHFGVSAESGNNTSNVLLNFDERGERVYKINVGLSNTIQSSEEAFFRMFYHLEILAFPVYCNIVHAIISFEENNKASCLNYLENVVSGVRDLLLIFYQNLTESRISRSVWLSYVQGFQGWGIGKLVNGEFVKYDGVSGNHILFFQALDAFLGMNRYLTDENMDRYIPINQRKFCLALKKHSFRAKLDKEGGGDSNQRLKDEFKKILNHLKLFRTAHRTRVVPYLKEEAPERLIMTAGKSLLEGSLEDALKFLDDMMVRRLTETI